MREKHKISKVLSLLLIICMILGMIPNHAFAARNDEKNAAVSSVRTKRDSTNTNVEKVYSYAGQMRRANTKQGTAWTKGGFTWDTERKTDSWRYFNGLVLDAFLMQGGEDNLGYAESFYSANINSDGSVINYHISGLNELDSVETARGLFDLLNGGNSAKYEAAIQYVYTELEKQISYGNCGGNLLHKQDASGNAAGGWETWNISLDGLYMAQPFLMECANAIDAGKLTLTDKNGAAVTSASIYDAVYNRFDWVAKNMRDNGTGLYNHAYDVNGRRMNGCFWSRAIGWYAMALVDTIEMMPQGSKRDALVQQLPTLFDGMMKYQDANTGMWYNVVNAKASSNPDNRLETSGSSMMAYAMMKAYNMGVADKKYGEAGLKAFDGTVENKVKGNAGNYTVSDIYLKSGVSTTNSGYCTNGYKDNEAKGIGALIMASTLANDTARRLYGTEEPNPGEPDEGSLTDATGIVITGSGADSVTVTDKSEDTAVKNALQNIAEKFVAYDIQLAGYAQGTEATVSIPVPEGFDAAKMKVYYISDDGTKVEEMKGAAADGKYTFKTTHFSIYAPVMPLANGDVDLVSGTGEVPGQDVTTYELDTDELDDGADYLIVNSKTNGTQQALRNNNGRSAAQQVTISNNGNTAVISANEAGCLWRVSNSGKRFSNNGQYIRLSNNTILTTTGTDLTVANQGSGAYRLSYKASGMFQSTYYLRCNNSTWGRGTNATDVYFYKQVKTSTEKETVTFSVSPKNVVLKSGETYNLTSLVQVSGKDAETSDITWKSNAGNIVTVNNGRITAVANGETTVTATLNEANGRTLVTPITLTVNVKVLDVKEYRLEGNDARTVNLNEKPDFSSVKLIAVYEDGTESEAAPLQIEGYDISKAGTYYATVSYGGKAYGTVRVTVINDPYKDLEEADEYPEYPNKGAVRIKKNASTGMGAFEDNGVAKVELDVAGISDKKGIDVVLVVDVSNSMAWSLENSGGANDAAKLPTGSQKTKLDNTMNAAKEFASILLEDNTGDAIADNTVSFVTFAGYDRQHSASTTDQRDYVDSVMTVFTGEKDLNRINTSFDGTTVTGVKNGTSADYTLTVTNADGRQMVQGKNRGNTNYDYAFTEASNAVKQIQTTGYADTGRETHIVFMTDGAPSHYQKENANGNSNRDYFPEYTSGSTSGRTYQQGKKINEWESYITGTKNTYATDLYKQVNGKFDAIGFDLANGGFGDYKGDEPTLKQVLANMVEGAVIPVQSTRDAEELTGFYTAMAAGIKKESTNASVKDIIGNDFTLQMANQSGTAGVGEGLVKLEPSPTIDIIAYDLYMKSNVTEGHEVGERTGESTVLESVSFNADGTEAYSSVFGDGVNIMETDEAGNLYIYASYFTYKKDARTGRESFDWKIGTITEKEVALSYYAYLKGSMEGQKEVPEDQTYYDTNEEAKLDYIDVDGKHAEKIFPKPAMPWKSAVTSYEFYLVNAKGEPVNHEGKVISFENRVIVHGPDKKKVNLNEEVSIENNTVLASDVLPDGYFLYDVNASYTVQPGSGEGMGSLEISEPSTDARKTVMGVTQTGAQTTIMVREDTDEDRYIKSHIAFGVRYEYMPEETEALQADRIVLDYGKAITEDVAAYDEKHPLYASYSRKVAGFVSYNKDYNPKAVLYQNPGKETLDTENGTYTIENGKARFQLKKMLSKVDKVLCVIELKAKKPSNNVKDKIYLYEELDVIPAANVYYETDFADGVFDFVTTDGEWETDATVSGDSQPDGPQDDGTIGKNQTYGYDSTYDNDKYFSDGSSYFVHGQGVNYDGKQEKYTESRFTFTGTGFDIISRTGVEQGMIRVDIYSDETMGNLEKSVTVLNKGEGTEEGKIELYQIPVVSVENLNYGEHYVVISVDEKYESQLFPVLSYGDEFYFDAIRIFNPIDVNGVVADELTENMTDAQMALWAYQEDNEAHANIREVRNMLIAQDRFDVTSENEGAIFVDRDSNNDATMEDYTAIGPNNEVYLVGDRAIGFAIEKDGVVPASIDLGVKSANGASAKLNVQILNASTNRLISTVTKDVQSSTAQYIDLLTDRKTAIESALNSNGKIYVRVTNGGEGILSITDLKVAYGKTAGTTRIVSDKALLDTMIFLASNDPAEEEQTKPDDTTDKKDDITSEVTGGKDTSAPESPKDSETSKGNVTAKGDVISKGEPSKKEPVKDKEISDKGGTGKNETSPSGSDKTGKEDGQNVKKPAKKAEKPAEKSQSWFSYILQLILGFFSKISTWLQGVFR